MEKSQAINEQTKEMQKVILGILSAIDKVCREHGLHYYMIAGTMLGAVRHKGFIPWDDDADVALPRRDYDILIAHANEWLPEQYELVSGDKDPNYPYLFARIQDKNTTYILRRCFNYVGGVPVDVFPLDGMTENRLLRNLHYMKYNVLKRLLYFSLRDPYKHGDGINCKFIKLCHKVLSPEKLHSMLDRVQREYDYDASNLIADHDNKPSRGILPKSVYGTPKDVSFEGMQFHGVENPDRYLRYCYGEYMKMPDKYPPQNFRYLNMKMPYAEYKNKER